MLSPKFDVCPSSNNNSAVRLATSLATALVVDSVAVAARVATAAPAALVALGVLVASVAALARPATLAAATATCPVCPGSPSSCLSLLIKLGECVNGMKCYNCGESGHYSRDCPKESAGGEKICYKCQQSGHVQAQCPNA